MKRKQAGVLCMVFLLMAALYMVGFALITARDFAALQAKGEEVARLSRVSLEALEGLSGRLSEADDWLWHLQGQGPWDARQGEEMDGVCRGLLAAAQKLKEEIRGAGALAQKLEDAVRREAGLLAQARAEAVDKCRRETLNGYFLQHCAVIEEINGLLGQAQAHLRQALRLKMEEHRKLLKNTQALLLLRSLATLAALAAILAAVLHILRRVKK